MYNKIMQDLNAANPSNVGLTKKLFRKLYQHIAYSTKKKDIQALQVTARALETFVSTNRSRFYQDMQDNPSEAYKFKRFLAELDNLFTACQEGMV